MGTVGTINWERLSQRIDEAAERWDISGAVVAMADDKIVHSNTYGYADRERGIRTPPDPTYLISPRSPLLMGLCIMQLIDRRKVALQDTLDLYIPEYRHASRITMKHLLYHTTGIPDYFHSGPMVDLSRSEHHQALSDEDRYRAERYARKSPITFGEALALIADAPLEFEPGSHANDWSASNALFLQEIIERVSGLSLVDYQRRHIFGPLEMSQTVPGCDATTVSYGCIKETVLVRLPVITPMDDALKTTVDDMVKLMRGLVNERLLSRTAWRTALRFDSEGMGIVAENVNGIACGEGGLLGYEFTLYFDQDSRLAYLHLTNEEPTEKWIDDEWCSFLKEMRETIEEETTYPRRTRLERYSERNALAAMSLSVHDSQHSFVDGAKTSLSYALARPRVRRPYVLMEGNRTVGLMVLFIDKKRHIYDVDVLLVDKRFQGRGFGRIMLREGLEILRQNGARRIEVVVSRFNLAAQRLCLSLGFTPAVVYEDGMVLRIDLDEHQELPATTRRGAAGD